MTLWVVTTPLCLAGCPPQSLPSSPTVCLSVDPGGGWWRGLCAHEPSEGSRLLTGPSRKLVSLLFFSPLTIFMCPFQWFLVPSQICAIITGKHFHHPRKNPQTH